MESCPVCYETFSSSVPETVARRLPCTHIVCTQCLTEYFEAECPSIDPVGPGVRCPECLECFAFKVVEAVPTLDNNFGQGGDCEMVPEEDLEETTAQESGDVGFQPSSTENGGTSTDNVDTSTENVDTSTENRSPAEPAGPMSRLAAFLRSNHTSAAPAVETDEAEGALGEGEDDAGGHKKCKVDGCSNRAVRGVEVCPLHTKRASVVSVSAMVHKFKDTKLSSVALKSDKVEVNRGGVAGAGEAGFDPDAIGQRFRRQERLELGEAVALIEAVKSIFREENNMVGLQAPVMVVGDVHGQYFDLLNILKKWRPDHSLLFLGDYVDRGQFSCEVILHLFALKLRHPDKVFLIRGNHECSAVSAHFGFKDECKAKYGLTVYYRFLLAFQTMPICALIQTTIGRIFACHGGISPEVKQLSDIADIDRFAEPEMQGPLCDMLWADPMNEDDRHKLTDDEYRQFLETDYVANQVRGCSYMFGYQAVQRFLRENRLMYMVRAHEVQEEGFRSHFPSPAWALAAAAAAAEQDEFTDEDSDLGSEEEEDSYDHVLADTSRHLNPTVLTVFSAPNYCDRYRNKAAILHIEKQGYYTVNLLEAEPHPDPVSETDVNVMQLLAMGNTCPYMPTSFREFLKAAVDLGLAVEPASNQSAPPTPTNEASGDAAVVRAETLFPGMCDTEDEEQEGDEDDEDDEVEQGLGLLPSLAPRRRGVPRNVSEPVFGRINSSVSSAGSAKERLSEGALDSKARTVPGVGERTGSGEGWYRRQSWDDNDSKGGGGGGGGGSGARQSFLDDFYSSLSRRSMRGFGGIGNRASSPGLGLLSRQNTWSIGCPAPSSQHYRKAHARDGINEMHPDVLNRRISHQESGEMEAVAAQVLAEAGEGDQVVGLSSPASTASVSPAATPKDQETQKRTYTVGETLARAFSFGFGGRAYMSAPARAEGGAAGFEDERGDEMDSSVAPASRGARRQFSLDISVGTPASVDKRIESKSREELAKILKHSSINELVEMEGDVEVELSKGDGDGTPAEANGPAMTEHREGSPTLEVLATPSPRDKRGSAVSGAPSPSQILFTHEEIVVLKLLFSLFDRKGKNFITRDDIVMYAEEGGDFAQLKEVDACMQAVDADKDGKVGLSDYINFAARLKEIHSLQQLQDASSTIEGSPTPAGNRLPASTD